MADMFNRHSDPMRNAFIQFDRPTPERGPFEKSSERPPAKPEPYPVPQDLKPNMRQARILSASYAGQTSEMTAINQYIYHFLSLSPEHDAVARTLRGIAIEEMRHLEALGACIRRLGMKPEYRFFPNGNMRYWNARFVAYGLTPKDMLQRDLQGEHAAINQYRVTIERVGEPQITALLERIIKDEEQHIREIEQALQTIG